MNIKGLTFIRPWPWAILHAGKRLENRTWKPAYSQLKINDWIAIHAGAKWSQDDAEWIEVEMDTNVPPRDAHPVGVIIGIAQYAGYVTSSDNPWFFGPYGWLLKNVQAIEPIPHRGALGLWEVAPAARTIIAAHILGVTA